MSRLAAALTLLAFLPLSPGDAARGEPAAMADAAACHGTHATAQKSSDGIVENPLRVAPTVTRLPASLIAANTSPLPDGNVEFCSGPGHQ